MTPASMSSMPHACRFVRLAHLLALPLLAAFVGCSDSTGPSGPRPPRGLVVLNASQAQGLTLLDTTGTHSSFISFAYPDYDGGSITLVNDTVLTTTSKGGGDQLIVTDLRSGSVVRFQMPAGSNPAAAIADTRTGGVASGWLVALRDLGAIANVRRNGSNLAVVTTILGDAGRCPVDVATRGAEVWSLDANADCRSTYAVEGPARLIRIAGAVRDTVGLPTLARGSGGVLVVVGDTAWVATSGEADFTRMQFTTPGVVTKVNLATRTIVGTRTMPAGTYGAGMKRGGDGRLYITAYTSTDFSRQDVFALDAGTLAFTGTRVAGGASLDLRKAGGQARPACGAATADAMGNVYCVEVAYAAAGASTVYVFGPDGTERRHLSAGQYAADIAIR